MTCNLRGLKMDYDYKFTIITAFYNTGKYLNESIESVINQDIGFEENIQLILVDDGSTDNSKQIALKYQKQYPNNILVLSKENGGVASARNLGLKHIKGEFVNFLDSDDKFSKNSIRAVNDFLLENDVDVVAIPLKFFDKQEGEHYLNYKFKKEGIIDLTKQYDYSHAHISSSFIRYDVLKDYSFDTDLVNGSDFVFMNDILIDIKKYGVINSTYYNYRKRQDSSSIMDTAKYTKRFFTQKINHSFIHLINESIAKEGHVLKFIQYIIALDLNGIITSPLFEKLIVEKNEIDEFWNSLNYVLKHIDEEIILNHNFLNNYSKFFYMYLKTKDFHVKINKRKNKMELRVNDTIINKMHFKVLRFDIVEIKNNLLCLSAGIISFCDNETLSFEGHLKDSNGNVEVLKCKKINYTTTKRHTRKYLNIPWSFYSNFDLEVPLEKYGEFELTFKLIYEENDKTAIMNLSIDFQEHCNLSKLSNFFVKDNKIVLFENDTFKIINYSKKQHLSLEVKSITNILKSNEKNKIYSVFLHITHYILYLFMKNKRIWIYMDRPEVADDNAKHLFLYSITQNDDVKKYFILDKNSKDFSEMKKFDKNIIAWGSLKHKILYILSEKLIISQINHEWINPFKESNENLVSGLITLQKCFLQHGVTVGDVSIWLRKYYHNFYLFVTVSDYERNSLLSNNYNYDENVIQTLGFPRFDNLSNEDGEKQILFMPTWRKDIENREAFLSSSFYTTINNFLNDENILNILKEHDYKLVFKPHMGIMPFIDLLDINESVTIDYDSSYQELFNKSSILITDYSSVFFDFAYLKKPIIYFQQNDDYHYDKGYFDFETMGFGDVLTSQEELRNKINYYLTNSCEMEGNYKKRVDNFFRYEDKNNCKRVYQWLLKH